MEEIFVDIIGYEGYQVSNFGRVKSLNYNHTGKEKILKGTNNKGYQRVHLRKGKISEYITIHQLVAMHFIPNPENKPEVHHIDHNKLNNHVDNLVWLTHEEHAAEHPERFKQMNNASVKARVKHINQFTLDGLFVRAWYSARDIQRELGYANQNIINCCKGGYFDKRRSKWVNITQYKGYIWKYAEDC